ncbi:MAG: hypothetical protein ACTSVI_17295 [Promethearchaeota archaeon]
MELLIKKRLRNILLGLVLFGFIISAFPGVTCLVFEEPKDGISRPIEYSFSLDAGEKLYFEFHSNATMIINYQEIPKDTPDGAVSQTLELSSWTYTATKNYNWIFNITLIAKDPNVAGLDIYVKYTYNRILGQILSYIMMIFSTGTGIFFLYKIIMDRKERQVEEKVIGKEVQA